MLGDPTYWAEQRKKFAVSPTAQFLVCWPGASLHLAGHVRATWQHVGWGLAAWPREASASCHGATVATTARSVAER